MTMRSDLLVAGLRWLAAAVLVGVSFKVGGYAVTKTEGYAAAVPLLIAMSLLVGSGLLIAPELIQWLTAPLRLFVDHLFFPGTPPDRGPPDYTLAQYYRREGRYAEALAWYQRLMRDYPQELRPYLEGMATAFESGNLALAGKIRRTGLRKLREDSARQEVKKAYYSMLVAAIGDRQRD